jgi:hypothetical protein
VSLCDDVRRAAERVSQRARFVRIDHAALEALAARLADEKPPTPDYDLAHHHRGTPASTLAFNLTLDSINFGSGYFPHLRKRGALSGYFTVATGLKDRFDAAGPWSAQELQALQPEDLATILHQEIARPEAREARELMTLFAAALRELGAWLARRFDGRFEGPVEAAAGSAERLAELLAEMPFYRDVAHYEELVVPFYKRAQIVPSDLALAFDGQGFGRFHDLGRLTIFADNLVPHVLRCEGVLVHEAGLAARIEAGETLGPGSPEEVEIRACGVHAVEELVAAIRARGVETSARALDQLLWTRGQDPRVKAHPRHRARSIYY